jgi:phosphoribosylformylglycinamidine synthase
MIAVSEAARNIVCSGGVPVAITNCLNFGNPYNPEVYYQFVHAIKGMGAACEKLGTPVTGGNVSFYNQSEDGPVYPTPTIGMVGILDSLDQKMSLNFKSAGDIIYLIGESRNDINCSEYLHHICGVSMSPAPYFDLDEEHRVQQAILKLIGMKVINSAHDISEGGLFTCVLESAMTNGLGFNIDCDKNIRKDAFLFGEAQSRVIVSVNPAVHAMFEAEMGDVPYSKIGIVNASGQVTVDDENWGYISDWKEAYDTALEKLLNN